LTTRARRDLVRIRNPIFFFPGETIIVGGSVPQGVFIFKKGQAVLFRQTTAGPLSLLRLAGDHEIFGIVEMFDERPFKTSLGALTQCELDEIRRSDLESFLNRERIPRSQLIELLGNGLQQRLKLIKALNSETGDPSHRL
jgi:CRP-like cAMP-binding protein